MPEHHRPSDVAILIGILLVALALRLYGLDAGLWHDEVLTYTRYARLPLWEIISTFSDQNQHMLYTILAHVSFLTFGESTWALRLPAVLFGVGSIGATYLFARQAASSREALLAAALLAISYHHIWFSQNARGYTGLLFWTMLSSWLLLRGLREARPRLWLFYAGASALGVYTNMTMLFVILGQFAVYLIALWARRYETWPDKWSGLFLGFCLAGVLTLLLHAMVLPQIFTGVVAEESTVPAWTNPLWTLLEFVKGMQVSFAGGFVAAAALVVFGAGLFSFARTNPAVVQLLMIPTLLVAAVVIGLGHHLWPRFFFFTMGFGALIIIRGFMQLGKMAARLLRLAPATAVPIGVTLCAGMILASASSLPAVYAPKQDFLGALNFIEANKGPGDAIATVGLATFTYNEFYRMDWVEVKTLADLEAVRVRAKRTWLLFTFAPHVQSVYPRIMESIQHDFTVVKEFYGTVGSGTIVVCRSDTPPS